jgi:hypothetical protein
LGGILGLATFWEELQAKLYHCFLWSLALQLWNRPGGVWGRISVQLTRGLSWSWAGRSHMHFSWCVGVN